MRSLIVFAAAVMAAGVLVARWADRSAPIGAPPAALAAGPAEPATNAFSSGTVILRPGNDGHFRTEARIDGRRLELIVDTGASTIALRAADAHRGAALDAQLGDLRQAA